MRVELFDFTLPPERIALNAVEPRDSARLLHVAETLTDRIVRDLPSLLNPGDILVMNDSRVIPARLFATLGDRQVEVLLHQPQGDDWLAFAKPARKLKAEMSLTFAPGFTATVLGRTEDGQVRLRFADSGAALMEQLHRHGHMPLPPYIDRADTTDDKARYQTVYAKHDGSVAAPTAGLHFTPALLEALAAKNIRTAYVTLHVGAGTFQPVKVDDTADHVMHREWCSISAETAEAINAARRAGGKVVAVGTTSLRVLESAAQQLSLETPPPAGGRLGGGHAGQDDAQIPGAFSASQPPPQPSPDGVGGDLLRAWSGETGIFITPGYRFRIVDRLMTNFHLPKSTLFMLVSAFAGLDRMQAAYAHAIAQGYRFYSYGDSSLLERQA